jgi:hypothetical protein
MIVLKQKSFGAFLFSRFSSAKELSAAKEREECGRESAGR